MNSRAHARHTHRDARAFSLLELMVGVTIIGVLAAAGGPPIARTVEEYRVRQELMSVELAFQKARDDGINRGVLTILQFAPNPVGVPGGSLTLVSVGAPPNIPWTGSAAAGPDAAAGCTPGAPISTIVFSVLKPEAIDLCVTDRNSFLFDESADEVPGDHRTRIGLAFDDANNNLVLDPGEVAGHAASLLIEDMGTKVFEGDRVGELRRVEGIAGTNRTMSDAMTRFKADSNQKPLLISK